ncbi:MAG: IS1595 family transposase [Flavobacteriales bacterium]
MFSRYPSNEECRRLLEKALWPNGPICPFCSHDKIYRFRNGRTFKCSSCKRNFGVTKGTVFEGTKLPLGKWFKAIHRFSSDKKGTASHGMARHLGITQPNAWYMLHKIRKMMCNHPDFHRKLSGTIEVDESYVGGKNKNRHYNKRYKGNQGRSLQDKALAWALVERGTGTVLPIGIKRLHGKGMRLLIKNKVTAGSKVMTDEFCAYQGLDKYFDHGVVNHGAHQYCNGDATTNTVEGFWSWLKRSIVGIYHGVRRHWFFRYLMENAFRYNTRNLTDSDRFGQLLTLSKKANV